MLIRRTGSPLCSPKLLATLKQTAIAVASVTLIASCGGGGGGDTPAPTPTPTPTPTPNNAPVATNVMVDDSNGGQVIAGEILNASYDYTDSENDAEGNSAFQWLLNGSEIAGATSLSYTILANDEGGQIGFRVTPVASAGTVNGSAISSSALTVSATPTAGPDKATFMNSLPQWSEFAPKERDEADEGREIVDTSQPALVEEIQDNEGIVQVCTTETVDFFESPEEYVMFAAPTNILYPGAFVEGRSIRDGNAAGDILPLTIAQRNTINVSIPACAIQNNFREVAPTQANVNSAVGAILAEAESLGQDCTQPRGNLTVETYQNEQQRALSAGFSGRYFGFSASASGSYSKTTEQSSVAAVFKETLYTVQIEAPQTPGDWFTDEFTPEKIRELEDAGRMGQGNIPAYVAQVTYGRMLTSTFTSNYSEQDMRAAIEFKYSNPAVDVQGDAAVRSQTIRENSSTTLSYLGGSAEATRGMLQSNDWTDYFNVPVTAADAVPISFELRSTSDNRLAVTQELTSYDRTTCIERVADNATFAFQAQESFTPNFTGNGQAVEFADINGDGSDDIIWANTNASGIGEFAVALSEGDGSFATLIQDSNINMMGETGELRLLVADVDNDSRQDIVLNIINADRGGNKVFVSFYKEDDNGQNTFVHSAVQDISQNTGGWQNYASYVGQMDAARGKDLVWNNVPNSTSVNRTYIAHAVDTSVDGFDLSSDDLFVRTGPFDINDSFTNYQYTFIDDFDGDGFDDIAWNALLDLDISRNNAVFYRNGTSTGLSAPRSLGDGSRWSFYTALTGDINGDGRTDIVYPRQRSSFPNFGIYSRLGVQRQVDGFLANSFTFYNDPNDHAALSPFFGESEAVSPDLYLADVNGDGTDDLIVNEKGTIDALSNNVAVGLSIPGSDQFSFTRESQTVPQSEDWSLFTLHLADVNGDDRQDVIWVRNASSNQVFVGLARGD